MSDLPQGPGWWQASDHKWYPPRDMPLTPPTAPAVPMGLPPTTSPTPNQPTTPANRPRLPMVFGVAAVAIASGFVGFGVGLAVGSGDEPVPVAERPDHATTSIGGGGHTITVDPGPFDNEPMTPVGERTAPVPLGTEVDLNNGWVVTVTSAETGPAAASLVADASQFNDPAATGNRYVLVEVAARFEGRPGTESEVPFFGVDIAVFGSDNIERQTFDTVAIAPDPVFESSNEVAVGGTARGHLVFEVGADETDLVARLQPGMTFDDAAGWIALG